MYTIYGLYSNGLVCNEFKISDRKRAINEADKLISSPSFDGVCIRISIGFISMVVTEIYHKTPLYKNHNCKSCTYLGRFNTADLYYCLQGCNLPTVIARYSEEGPDYTSGLESSIPDLVEARRRAAMLGVLNRV